MMRLVYLSLQFDSDQRRFAIEDPRGFLGQYSGGSVIFGGSDTQQRSDWPVYSWRRLLIK